MDLINITPLGGLTYQKLGPRGQGWDVVVLRGTFRPDADGTLQPIAGEHSLSLADRYHGDDPMLSALRHESDVVWTKPACDVIVAGHAHAPGGQAAMRWDCAVQMGSRRHVLTVTGPRLWRKRLVRGWRLDDPQATMRVRLDYGLAFGGDPCLGQRKAAQPLADNPVGVGWYRAGCMKSDLAYAAPQFEALGRAYTHFDRKYPAVGFSPLSRWWPQRVRHVGTYGAQWRRLGQNWLADDFDTRFYNGAPEPLQAPYAEPGERVVLIGLWPGNPGAMAMRLPGGFPTVDFHRPAKHAFDVPMNLDTVLVDTDEQQVHLTWRLAVRQDLGTTACVTRWPHWQRAYFRSPGPVESTSDAKAMAHG